jgi:hypothetical protein
VTSWLRRTRRDEERSTAELVAEVTSSPPPADGQPLICTVFRRDGSEEMEIETGGQRITDLLNGMDDESTADVLLVVPPSQELDPRRRLHRPGQDVRVVVGPYEVVGLLHVPPGTQATGFIARVNPRFVPITQATIRLVDDESEHVAAPVVLANLRLAASLREIAPEDQQPRMEPLTEG